MDAVLHHINDLDKYLSEIGLFFKFNDFFVLFSFFVVGSSVGGFLVFFFLFFFFLLIPTLQKA